MTGVRLPTEMSNPPDYRHSVCDPAWARGANQIPDDFTIIIW